MNKLNGYKKIAEKIYANKAVSILYLGDYITAGAATYPQSGIGFDGKEYNENYEFNKISMAYSRKQKFTYTVNGVFAKISRNKYTVAFRNSYFPIAVINSTASFYAQE